MRILLLSSAYNSLTQHAHVELKALGHWVGVAVGTTADAMREAVHQFQPELVLCPMLAHVIPRDLWERYTFIILHPGIVGDRGGNSLDWAILNEEPEWGVTAVEAAEHVDSGPIWATYEFKMRAASKSSIYRDELTRAAVKAMLVAVRRFESGLFVPAPLDYSRPAVRGRYRPFVKPEEREVDWKCDGVATILRKIRSGDGAPGVLDDIGGMPVYLYGAHEEGTLVGKPGEIIATRHGAICRAAVDGAVWISHLKMKGSQASEYFKLPSAMVVAEQLRGVPEVPLSIHAEPRGATYRDVWYEEHNDVGYVNFRFYNGAMGTDHCRRLEQAVQYASKRPTKVIVLFGGQDFWSNGIHLNLIEAADDPAQESWENINAMDDLVLSLLAATDHLTVAAMYGSAGAGGVMLALAADRVLAREGIVLNPHYKGMGGLYGSEYWTYSLPKRVGAERALQLTEQCLPVSVYDAKTMGLIDDIVIQDDLGHGSFERFRDQIIRVAESLARGEELAAQLARKQAEREAEERVKALAQYRREELEEMKHNFWGEDRSYHLARSAFVRKRPRPAHLKCSAALENACANAQCDEAKQAARNRCALASLGWT
ncbi:enoyl-CoA hydratase-related protein [Methylococcus sp. EFPC2]|uniref:enoyl-CoA hydratase-related protein n=1 Tax=Methylococcus sp. EFPC2 TaxID=2812648 RepID=UPI0019684016|nr:enoyl-CoA hydratase-related protein [Methylococcus sp. EFPC2]QSA97940.1 hydrogenase maturation protein [Methylococcus sp. EFPC2]